MSVNSESDAGPIEGSATEGLRERKKRERGQALRRAAIDLALEKGYQNVTIEDICERCGVSRRTFFNYFPTKEEALLGRSDTVFDDEDQPTIEAFEAGGPSGRLIDDLQHLLTFVVRTRLSKREEMDRHRLMLKQDPSLLQLQLARMGRNERLFRQIIQRRLDGRARVASATASEGDSDAAERASGEGPSESGTGEDEAVSVRAEALAALAMMALKATFTRMRRTEGDPDPVINELFDELRAIFREESV